MIILDDIYQNKQFEEYFNYLIEYNKKVNLTAITEKEEVYIKHFYDSILASDYIKKGASVVDIGTGAGFPGIPLKIARPDINLHLVDALNKRIVFLNSLKNILDLSFNTYHARAEEFCKANREKFDVAVSRAVAKLSTLIEYCLPSVKIGGLFISYKGANIEEELEESKKALEIIGGKIKEVKKFLLPDNLGERNLIVIEKVKETPKSYPRGQNLPKLKPLS